MKIPWPREIRAPPIQCSPKAIKLQPVIDKVATSFTTMLDGGRDGLTLTVSGDQLFAIGGKIANVPTGEVVVARFDDSALPTASAGLSLPGPPLPEPRSHGMVAHTGSSVTVTGGCVVGTSDGNCTQFSASVLEARGLDDGGLGPWVDLGPVLPQGRQRVVGFWRGSQHCIFGGSSAASAELDDVLCTLRQEDGGLPAMIASTARLVSPRSGTAGLVQGGAFLVQGGNRAGFGYLTALERHPLFTDGGIGNATVIGAFDGGRTEHNFGRHGESLIAVGGYDGVELDSVQLGVPAADGGYRFSGAPPLVGPTAVSAMVEHRGHLFVHGGNRPGPPTIPMQVAAWLPDGGLSRWKNTGPSADRHRHGAVMQGDHLLLVSGTEGDLLATTELVPLRVPQAHGVLEWVLPLSGGAMPSSLTVDADVPRGQSLRLELRVDSQPWTEVREVIPGIPMRVDAAPGTALALRFTFVESAPRFEALASSSPRLRAVTLGYGETTGSSRTLTVGCSAAATSFSPFIFLLLAGMRRRRTCYPPVHDQISDEARSEGNDR